MPLKSLKALSEDGRFLTIFKIWVDVHELEVDVTVGFHNFNLRIFNLSLKFEQINCGCFFDTMSDFNVPVSRHKKTR